MKKKYRLVFVCDAGMGSSALGASLLRRKLIEHNIVADVKNASVDNGNLVADIIVCHVNFAAQLQKMYPKTLIISLSDFMHRESYNKVVEIMQNIEQNKLNILRKENILVNCAVETSDEAILSVGKLLVDGGYVKQEYVQGMLDRDHSLSVFMGNTLAIPHGEFEFKQYIKHSGIVIKVYPTPLDWHGEKVHLVLGLAGIGEDHINILANCATVFSEMDDVERIVKNQSVDEIYDLLTAEEE
jgi:mannitol/fructose-specific phosphotransferase system IIA component/galactitol-specific phosphotransferase system IIB component